MLCSSLKLKNNSRALILFFSFGKSSNSCQSEEWFDYLNGTAVVDVQEQDFSWIISKWCCNSTKKNVNKSTKNGGQVMFLWYNLSFSCWVVKLYSTWSIIYISIYVYEPLIGNKSVRKSMFSLSVFTCSGVTWLLHISWLWQYSGCLHRKQQYLEILASTVYRELWQLM